MTHRRLCILSIIGFALALLAILQLASATSCDDVDKTVYHCTADGCFYEGTTCEVEGVRTGIKYTCTANGCERQDPPPPSSNDETPDPEVNETQTNNTPENRTNTTVPQNETSMNHTGNETIPANETGNGNETLPDNETSTENPVNDTPMTPPVTTELHAPPPDHGDSKNSVKKQWVVIEEWGDATRACYRAFYRKVNHDYRGGYEWENTIFDYPERQVEQCVPREAFNPTATEASTRYGGVIGLVWG